MSWTADIYIGEMRPWPDALYAVRDLSGERRLYVPERTCHEIEDEDTGFIICSECGAVHDEDYTSYHCWCCGAKVVDE